MERKDIDYNEWDEDGFPSRGYMDEEYVEDYEEDDDPYNHAYSAIQGNWNLEDYDDADSFERIGRHTKIRSVRAYTDNQIRAKKNAKIKRRSEAQAREEQRQKYYHYGNDDSEEQG